MMLCFYRIEFILSAFFGPNFIIILESWPPRSMSLNLHTMITERATTFRYPSKPQERVVLAPRIYHPVSIQFDEFRIIRQILLLKPCHRV